MLRISSALRSSSSALWPRSLVQAPFAQSFFSTFYEEKPKRKSSYDSGVPKWKKDREEKFRLKKARFDQDQRPSRGFNNSKTKSSKKVFEEPAPSNDRFAKSTKKNAPRTTMKGAREEKQVEESKTLADIYAEKDAEWNQMRKIRTIPKLAKKNEDIQTPSAKRGANAVEATESEKKERIIEKQKAQRLKNKQSRVFDGLRAPPQDIVAAMHTYEEPDAPRDSEPRSLNVAVIGRPNAGKSSLMNALLGFNVSAVSAKYNTTRDRVLGVLTEGDAQIAFYDTPGLVNLKDSHTYVRSLAVTAAETMSSVDLSLMVVDAVKRLDDQALEALKNVAISSAREAAPIMLVMNKMDLVGPAEKPYVAKRIEVLSKMIEETFEEHAPKEDEFEDFEDDDDEEYEDDEEEFDEDDFDIDDEDEFDDEDFDDEDFDDFDFEDEKRLELEPTKYLGDNCFKVSAFKDKDVQKLRQTLLDLAVERPWMYNSRMKSDRSDLDLVTEIIREKLYRRFNQELPYMITQENRGWTPFSDKSIRIDQDLLVPSDRHIKTLLGKNGDTLREIGTAARKDIQKLLGQKVHLYLNVRSKSGRK